MSMVWPGNMVLEPFERGYIQQYLYQVSNPRINHSFLAKEPLKMSQKIVGKHV